MGLWLGAISHQRQLPSKLRTLVSLAAALTCPLTIRGADPATPIQYVVVIFDENNSFDHYFATYPNATNPPGEPQFTALPNTPTVNGLTPELIAFNRNSTKPFRLDRTQEALCDNDNHYTDEQNAYHGGLLDKFPESSNGTGCLGDHPKPANGDHLKTGQRKS
jgi:phospholipase C